jgi:hypothetical protein
VRLLILQHSIGEIQKAQLRILVGKSPAARFRLGSSLTDTAGDVVAFRIKERNPDLSLAQASYLAFQERLPR